MKIKQQTKRIYYLISVAVVIVVVAISFFNEKSDKRTFIKCEPISFNFISDTGIYAFDEKYFYFGYVKNTGEFTYRKFVDKFNKLEAFYTGVSNEKGNEQSVFVDRVNGTVKFYYSKSEMSERPVWPCEQIKKPKIADIQTKF
jgi:regulatory protein YycH of two-component signal transduction system YycFG